MTARIHIRQAGRLDANTMADLLNEIIAVGGTTAMTQPVSAAYLIDKMAPSGTAWHLAENEDGTLQGFQWVAPNPTLPADMLDIATFTRVGATGLGTGSALFERTKPAARALDATYINATIRADNSGGLAYYQSRGFERYDVQTGVDLGNGLVVDRVKMRYEL